MIFFSKDLIYKKGKLLPNIYQQVEYIQSQGNQYINTGIPCNEIDYVDIEMKKVDGTNDASVVIGNYIGGQIYWCPIIYSPNANGICGIVSYSYGWFNTYIHPTTRTRITASVKVGETATITVNGTDYTAGTTDSLSRNACLFSASSDRAWAKPVIIYSCVLKENNIVKANLIPCYRKSDGVIGMYDSVRKTFLTNAGSGVFIKGPDV